MAKIYVAGSLQNSNVAATAMRLRDKGHEVFVDWFSGGPEADVKWRENEIRQGRNLREAVKGAYAQNILRFDETWMEWAECIVIVCPAGKSAHMELVHFLRNDKPGYVYLPDGDPDRWDVMLGWATDIFYDLEEMDAEIWNQV